MTEQRVTTIIFDLDGTLYEDTHHFDYFANKMAEKLPKDLQAVFMDDYKCCLDGYHPLQIGRIYDVKEDLILVHENQQVLEAYNWDGTAIPTETVKHLYPQPVSLDLTTMISIGDLWWVPSSIAYHYKLDTNAGEQAFLETRAYMMSEEFRMSPIPGLKQLLENLHTTINLVLLTNSPEPDSEAILTKLGISEYFHKKLFNGKKPIQTKKRFNEIMETFQIEYSTILSVGDNWINEIQPANELGCQTILIDTHEVGDNLTSDYRVTSMSEAIPIIRGIVSTELTN